MKRILRSVLCSLLVAALAVPVMFATVHAQPDLQSAWTASRAELERRVVQLDALAASTAYSERARARAAGEAAGIRRRLSEGDFRVGDRMLIVVAGTAIAEGVTEARDLEDTVTVLSGARINLREVGEIALAGVLRSELQARVSAAVGEVLLNARATVRPFVRLSVYGEVFNPGYFTVPLETRLDALVMLAGGPTAVADPSSLRLLRGDTIVLDESEVRQAIAEGTVIADLGLREGDQLRLDRGRQPMDPQQRSQFLFFFLSPIISTLLFGALR